MKIVQLNAENIKRLKAVQIRPDGAVVPITGKNGQGKSSVLDAIAYALGGKGAQPSKPMREGSETASVVVDLGDIIVERTWTANDKTTLSVRSKDGAKYPTPQAILDKLVGELTFDPLAFLRMDPDEQVATLKEVAGLDFTKLDADRAAAFADRTNINRDLKAAESQLAAIPRVEAPDAEIKIADLLGQQGKANEKIRENDLARQRVKANIAERDRAEAEVERLTEALEEMKQRLSDREQMVAKDAKLKFIDPDISAINKQINEAESINRNVRVKQDRAKREAAVAALKKKSEALTNRIEFIDAEKDAALVASKMPIEGLSFSASGVTYHDVPFEQASSAEQLRVSVAMGLSLNPKLRIMLIRDGSLLDSRGLEMLAEMAETNDAQIWIERVSDGEPVGIVIEDGRIAEVREPVEA